MNFINFHIRPVIATVAANDNFPDENWELHALDMLLSYF